MCQSTDEQTGTIKATIEHDDHNESPRDWGNVGTMVCWHGRYKLGDDHSHDDPHALLSDMLDTVADLPTLRAMVKGMIRGDADARDDYVTHRKEWERKLDTRARADMFREYAQWQLEHSISNEQVQHIRDAVDTVYVILPLHLYDHSGITMQVGAFSCPFDSGQVGYIYVSLETAIKEYGDAIKGDGDLPTDETTQRDAIAKRLTSEVEVYDQHLTGDVWRFEIERVTVCEHCGEEHTEHIDSCGGFYGSNPEENGMLEHIADEHHQALIDAQP